ncbi:hypothetical protein, partial [Actinomadura oligospora]|uniref:hypothetical protein n=1 Tax=Actinomadura oligospora TaxID=111804 RepID=UPI001B802445
MSGDDHGADGKRSSQRRIKQPALPPGPLRELKDWVYWLYQQAGAPSLDTIHRGCEHDGTAEVAGWPGRDTIHRIIAAAAVPPSQPDTVAVARVLARLARQDADEAAARTRDLWLQAQTSIPLGTPLDQVRDPFDLHVHRPIVSDETAGVPPLPPYVRRAHDDWLAAVVDHARCGQSRMAVLVAGSSAGKTRALWEALEPLRQTGRWRLWHPFDPTRPKAAVAGLDQVGPSTVVWLNETQEYLDAPDDFPEQIAAKLHSLLTDPTRAPVLVLGTLWPEHHAALTRRPGTQVTQLLDSATIRVPETFQGADLHAMTQAAEADARLASAVGQAEGGHITQYLAGAPKLLARLNDAPAASRAVIEAAMDARRMGHRNALPHALLEAAAPAYLTDLQWNGLRENWLEDALAYTSEPCKGARGPVTRIGPARIPSARRANHPSTAADGAMGEGGPTYRLADYLEQHGRHHRADQIPPPAFWTAAAARACPDDLDTLARAAEERGLLRDAAQLYKHATGYGDSHAAYKLVKLLQQVHPTDRHAAHWAATHSSLTDPVGVARLLKILRKVGAEEQVMVLLARAPATHTALTDASAIAELLSGLREVGAEEQVAALAKRAAVHVPAIALLGVARLLVSLRKAGASEQVAALAKRTAAHSAFLNLSNVTLSLDVLWQAGAGELVSVLAERAAAHTPINELFRVTGLLRQLRQVGAEEQIAVLLARDPAAHAPLTSTSGVADLLDSLQRVGANAQVAALTKRVAMQSPLPLPSDVAELVDSLRQVGAEEQAATLTGRAAACLPLTNAADVAELLDILQQVGAEEQVAALLARNPAANIPLTNA